MTAPADRATAEAIAPVVAAERTRMVASLIRLTGDWDLAEDCVQDAVERALVRWPSEGMPRSPAAWLTTAARNRALALDGRVALTLKTVAGLGTAEIARAFLVSEPTMSQRLLRTRRKIANAGIPYRLPPDELLAERTSGVLAVLYLIFNAGYGRRDDHLAVEALRLARLLVELLPGEDEARGLLALIAFQLSRRSTRFDAQGDLVPMEEQDRGRWDAALIEEGRWQLRRATSSGRPPGPYRLQAQIAACHATSTAEATAWGTIADLYDALLSAQPSPVIALNRAIAVGFRDGYEAGLAALDALDAGALAGDYLLPAARADFLRRLGRGEEARRAYLAALQLAPPASPSSGSCDAASPSCRARAAAGSSRPIGREASCPTRSGSARSRSSARTPASWPRSTPGSPAGR